MKPLRISTIRHKVPKIILAVVLIALAGCIIRVAVWEHYYYLGKEGSTRAVAPDTGTEVEETIYDETEVTEAEVAEWTVAPDKPRYITIEKLGIHNAIVKEIGVKANNQLDTPPNIFHAGWYRNSGKPGLGGTLLMDGHNGGPTKAGIFKHLETLVEGDKIIIERGDGERFTYEVYENKIIPLAEADAHMAKMQVSPINGRESISIITCTGGWIAASRNYDHRVMLRAILVES